MSAQPVHRIRLHVPTTWVVLLLAVLMAAAVTLVLSAVDLSRTAGPVVPAAAQVLPSPAPGPLAVVSGPSILA
jgi:hypothetical protein